MAGHVVVENVFSTWGPSDVWRAGKGGTTGLQKARVCYLLNLAVLYFVLIFLDLEICFEIGT